MVTCSDTLTLDGGGTRYDVMGNGVELGREIYDMQEVAGRGRSEEKGTIGWNHDWQVIRNLWMQFL